MYLLGPWPMGNGDHHPMLQADTRVHYWPAGEMDKMTTIYILLALAAVFVELSPKVNTDYVLKKFGLVLVFIGCMTGLIGKSTMLIPVGMLIYLGSNIVGSFYMRHKRRASDRRAHG